MTTIADTNHPWLVIAAVCECDKVAVTVMDAAACDQNASAEADGEHEIVATGTDWLPLVEQTAKAMAERSGVPISGQCTVVVARDQKQQQAIDDTATALLYRLQAEAAEQEEGRSPSA